MIRQTINKTTDVLTFGKFKGKAVFDILHEEPSYIFWLSREKIVEFSEEILEEASHSEDWKMSQYRFMDIGDIS